MKNIEKVKAIYRSILAIDQETPQVISFVRRVLEVPFGSVVLDIGCGYGRTLRALRKAGIDAIGIDVNPQIVAANKSAGLTCFTPEEIQEQPKLADVLVMSHVVEHFSPLDLVAFLDTYLSRLCSGGHLIVATPLLSDRFFDDFDHIRPYQPVGFSMVFGGGGAQVQYLSRHRLALVDLWFRRSPYAIAFARGLYLPTWTSRWVQVANLFGAIAFRLTGGLIGRTTGWVGLYRKN